MEAETTPWQGMVDGFRYMRDTPLVNVLIRVVGVYSIFGLPFLAMMPVVARNVLHTGATGYGLLLTCVGVGALDRCAVARVVSQRVPRGRLFIWSSYAFAILLVIFSLVHSLVAAAVDARLRRIRAPAHGLARERAHAIDLARRAARPYRVGLRIRVRRTRPVGAFIAGAVARAFGVEWAIGGGAALMLAYAGMGIRAISGARRRLTVSAFNIETQPINHQNAHRNRL